jgi:hypothetical protein
MEGSLLTAACHETPERGRGMTYDPDPDPIPAA